MRFRSPAGTMDAPLRAGLLAKAELIALLTAKVSACHRWTG